MFSHTKENLTRNNKNYFTKKLLLGKYKRDAPFSLTPLIHFTLENQFRFISVVTMNNIKLQKNEQDLLLQKYSHREMPQEGEINREDSSAVGRRYKSSACRAHLSSDPVRGMRGGG